MNFSWKLYRKRFMEGLTDAKASESMFVLGIDMGNHSSSLAYYDINRKIPETIDISGGYGKPSMPTALQYAKDSREWVFGEYALLNRGLSSDALFTHLLEKLPKREYLDVDGKPQTAEYVLGIFLREFVSNCKNLNPKAEIAGVTLAVPGYITEEAQNSLRQVFAQAGWDKSLIAMDTDRECVFTWYFNYRKGGIKTENIALLDFGARELRGGVYGITPGGPDQPGKIECLSSLFDKNCGTDVVDEQVTELLTEHYLTQTETPRQRLNPKTAEQIQAFAYQHKDLLFQQNMSGRPVKLYYNFVYPPIVYSVTEKTFSGFVEPFKERFIKFLERLFAKSMTGKASVDDISAVICTGGGFEMLWARNAVAEFFKGTEVISHKNPKSLVAEGAALRSAYALGISGAKEYYREFYIEDSHKLKTDIGVGITVKSQNHKQTRFYPVIERNSFWWQEHDPVSFILTDDRPPGITIYSRGEDGELHSLGAVSLDGLIERPAGATRISMRLHFESHDRLTAKVKDMGFGEMFPTTDFVSENEFLLI